MRQFVETEEKMQLFYPTLEGENPDTAEPHRFNYYLTLADIALAQARKEQERIKEKIRPNVERYRRLTDKDALFRPLQRKTKACHRLFY